MLAAAGAAFLAAHALLKVPCWSLLFIVAAIAWPMWHVQKEYAQFRRRAVLAGVSPEDSWVRRWFWSGNVSGVWQAFIALFWAAMLLAFGALLQPAQWVMVAADVAVLALLIGPVQRRLAGQVRAERLGLVARRWPLAALNLLVLTLGFLILDFFLIGAPDTRGVAWNVVAENAFAEANAAAECRWAGWLVGGLAAIDRVTWHAAQVLVPSLPGVMLKLATWAVFLLQAGVFAFAFTRLQLGVVSLVERRDAAGENTSPTPFLLTIAALALPYLYATILLRDYDPSVLATGARTVVAWANPCRLDTARLDAFKSGLAAEVDAMRIAARQRANARIDTELDAIFGNVERRVDDYLDWYFSVLGEYERLAAQATGKFAEQMREQFEQRLFAGTTFDDQLMRANSEIAAASVAQMAASATRLGAQIKADVNANPCRIEMTNLSAVGNLDRDLQRASLAAGGGAAVGVVATGLLARKAVSAAASRVASKKVFQVAATLPAKMAARRGGSIVLSAAGGTALCAPLGPFAALCGVGAGIATWLALDQAFIKIDEYRFRAEMRAEMLEALLGQKAALAGDLQAMHHAAIDQMAANMRRSVDGAFIPVRDGL